jgi:SAM-dependent methyltransferase
MMPRMTTLDTHFAGSIPALYEEHLGPLLFEPYADDLAARIPHARSVLETAAGTGVVTRALARALPAARIVATDLNPAMLEIAASRASAPSVTWKQADAQKLPFGDAEFDTVVCQFGVMFFPDKQAGYREAMRVLAPGGRFVFNVWDVLAANEVTRITAETVAKSFPQDPPRFIERTPFGYFDPAVIRAELERAGFGGITIDSVEKVTRCKSAEQAAVGLCKGTPLRSEIEARDAARLEQVTDEVRKALVARFGPSSFDNRMRALVVSASR